MNNYETSDIKSIRNKLGLTQSALAKQANVSQSLIAKIESGKIDPTYSNIKKIFSALDSLQKKESLRAKDFIHKSVVSCQEEELVRDVIKKMKKYEISQLPVMRDQSVVGVVSESRIIEKLINGADKDLKVREVMGDIPPIISMNTEEIVISNLLKFFSMVLVQDNGKLKGIITRSDILRKIYV
ncbi:MAG: CBS domain-containing protein [Nanoarchaeota archaeon]|nr:CBS domain-containing protein [Nanoarchaeota archaeon]MBU1604109.1 CBS domain-containing protein [Nanoarchaeota archaeon]MBU2443329.1 CBS domain-containing protein [Nanoarchaeota archaeon]